jgi:hypothetical protein
MALKPWTMSFKETNPDEVKLHEILSLKTSPMAFAKDILIDVLVRGNSLKNSNQNNEIDKNSIENNDEINEIFDI